MGMIGAETWSFAVLENLGRVRINEKQIRLKVEKQYIFMLRPALNIKSNRYHSRKVQQLGQSKGQRLPLRFRKLQGSMQKKEIRRRTFATEEERYSIQNKD